jgi:putative protease
VLQIGARAAVACDAPSAVAAIAPRRDGASGVPGASQLHLLVRTPQQLEAAIEMTPASITLDYLDLYGLKPSVERVKESGIEARAASPRVLKPGEGRILDFLLSLESTLLVRSGGMLQALREREHPTLIGDFSLNVANQLSADTYFKLGIDKITPTHDLNADQISKLGTDVK